MSAQVDVVSVADCLSPTARSAGMLGDLAYDYQEEVARHTLHIAIAKLAQNGVTAHGYIYFEHIVDAVSRHAAALSSNMVVVGHRRRSRLSRWLGQRPVHLDLADRLSGSTVVTVTLPLAKGRSQQTRR
ncbi:universal stress protein [Paraburkholderia strydomiana]|uniref:universal stress protein n=1 Tax=Paraburkholderia strydomiana TaxID=1245417 RepID=UPI0020355083|nr:universal stress protein [Paraburkholderia strydomiana]